MSYNLSPEAEDAIVAAVRKGIPLKTAVTAAGVRWRDFVEWLQLGTDESPRSDAADADELAGCRRLNERITQAQAQHQADMVDAIHQAATMPNPKTGLPDWRAGDAILSKHPAYRGDWFEQRQTRQIIDVQQHPAHTIVRELSDAELLMLGAGDDDNTAPSELKPLPAPSEPVNPDQPEPRRRQPRKGDR